MYLKRHNIETVVNGKADEVVEELFESFFNRHQNSLERSMKGKELVFDFVHLLSYKCHK